MRCCTEEKAAFSCAVVLLLLLRKGRAGPSHLLQQHWSAPEELRTRLERGKRKGQAVRGEGGEGRVAGKIEEGSKRPINCTPPLGFKSNVNTDVNTVDRCHPLAKYLGRHLRGVAPVGAWEVHL